MKTQIAIITTKVVFKIEKPIQDRSSAIITTKINFGTEKPIKDPVAKFHYTNRPTVTAKTNRLNPSQKKKLTQWKASTNPKKQKEQKILHAKCRMTRLPHLSVIFTQNIRSLWFDTSMLIRLKAFLSEGKNCQHLLQFSPLELLADPKSTQSIWCY